MLSMFHDGQITDSGKLNRKGEAIQKPNCVLSYNNYMCGVDRCDQLTSYYSPLRKSLKWYRKVVLHFLDIGLTNAYLLYRKVGGSSRPRLADRRQHRGPGRYRRTSCLLPSQIRRPVTTERSTLHGPYSGNHIQGEPSSQMCPVCETSSMKGNSLFLPDLYEQTGIVRHTLLSAVPHLC